jgi:hypothetical protein
MRRHRFMFGKAFDGKGPLAFCDAASLEGPAEALRAVVGQLASQERSRPAAIARGAYLRSLTGLASNDNEGASG